MPSFITMIRSINHCELFMMTLLGMLCIFVLIDWHFSSTTHTQQMSHFVIELMNFEHRVSLLVRPLSYHHIRCKNIEGACNINFVIYFKEIVLPNFQSCIFQRFGRGVAVIRWLYMLWCMTCGKATWPHAVRHAMLSWSIWVCGWY